VLVVGANGTGKTNLLESLHVCSQGFSPRTRADSQLIRFGAERARVALEAGRTRKELELEVVISRGEGKRAQLNGAPLRATEELRSRLPALVFTPDRLAVVKGGPAVRRAYFDRTLTRLFPARAALPLSYGEALGQRNACLRKIALGLSSRDALEPWNAQVTAIGAALQAARRLVIEALSPRLAALGEDLGLEDCKLTYRGEDISLELLESRLARDLERATTGCGPHLDEVLLTSGQRELRFFGSQGEQRTAVLALLLAEAELLAEEGAGPPVLLLDDVLSELDLARRKALAERLARLGQTIVTATREEALPVSFDQLVRVRHGVAEAV
jgi:DNA replication and repair protein RecF